MNKHPFIENKYSLWYFKLVSNPFSGDEYAETHHIIPKAMGGSNSKSNLVRLTAKQHFVAHHILTKMTAGIYRRKAEAAFRAIAIMKNPKAGKSFITISPTLYEEIRSKHAIRSKKHMTDLWATEEFRTKMSTCRTFEERSISAKKGKTAEGIERHRQSLLGRKHLEETKMKMRIKRTNRFKTDPVYREQILASLQRGLATTKLKAKMRAEQRIKDAKTALPKYCWQLKKPGGEVINVISIYAFCAEVNLSYSHLFRQFKFGEEIRMPKIQRKTVDYTPLKNSIGWEILKKI